LGVREGLGDLTGDSRASTEGPKTSKGTEFYRGQTEGPKRKTLLKEQAKSRKQEDLTGVLADGHQQRQQRGKHKTLEEQGGLLGTTAHSHRIQKDY
jgi:hypothetical protein